MKKLAGVTLLAVVAVSCSHDINNKEAVRQGVVDYLAQRKAETGLDMSLMNVDVSSVSFQKNEAHATVSFKPKGSDVGGMAMNYVLERRGDKWVVRGRQDSGMSPHGGTAPGGVAAPGAMPDPSQMPPAMPPNHPPVEGANPKAK